MISLIEGKRINILIYHNVASTEIPIMQHIHNVSPNVFEAQIRYLNKHYQILSLTDLIQALKTNTPVRRAVAITFDDGYRSILDNAIPVLYKYAVPATIFLITDLLENKKLFWRNKLSLIISKGKGAIFLEILKSLYPKNNLACLNMDNIFKWTKNNYDKKLINLSLDLMFKKMRWDEKEIAGEMQLYFNLSDISKVDRKLISFGSHTLTHPVLSKVPVEEQKREIVESFSFLKEKLACKEIPFAYPFGEATDFTAETEKIVVGCGYSSIFAFASIASDRTASIFNFGRKAAPSEMSILFRAFMRDLLPEQLRTRIRSKIKFSNVVNTQLGK